MSVPFGIQESQGGVACPACGCRHWEVAGQSTQWGRLTQRRQCRFCSKTWSAVERVEEPEPDVDRGVVYHVLRCPNCQSDETVVTSTRRPIRYHKCKACGCRFQSYER